MNTQELETFARALRNAAAEYPISESCWERNKGVWMERAERLLGAYDVAPRNEAGGPPAATRGPRVVPPLQLDRPLCVLDIESTGTDVAADRIITLGILRVTSADLFGQGDCARADWRVNPGFPIPPASTRVHGITDERVAGCPSFISIAHQVMDFLHGADLCGYNARNFDVPLLYEEFRRAGIEWDLAGVRLVDAHEIFRRREPRDLSAAVRKFCGREHAGAHSALADAEATWEVLQGQRAAYADLREATVQALHDLCAAEELEGQPAARLDLAGYIVRTADGIARYTLKKVRGVAVEDDPGFGEWMLRNAFPQHTKQVLRGLLWPDRDSNDVRDEDDGGEL